MRPGRFGFMFSPNVLLLPLSFFSTDPSLVV